MFSISITNRSYRSKSCNSSSSSTRFVSIDNPFSPQNNTWRYCSGFAFTQITNCRSINPYRSFNTTDTEIPTFSLSCAVVQIPMR